ncbi:MAG: DMT family transporter, partial [Nevskia sp.]|nr:DMT family transporter [Nevskia sp.]
MPAAAHTAPAPSPARHSLGGLLLGALLIGLGPIFVRLADVGPTAAAFWRVALALPLLLALQRATRMPPPPAGTSRAGLWLAGLAFAGDLAVWHQSIRLTSVANATLLANLAPVFLTLTLHFGMGQRHSGRFWLGLALAVAGAAVLLAGSLRIGAQTALGDLCGIVAAAFYAAYQLVVSRSRRWFSAADVMLRSSIVSAALLLALALATAEPLWPRSAHGWAVLGGLAIVTHVCGQGLIAWALAHLPPAFSSVALLVQPVAAAIFAWLLLGEGFGAQQAVGGAVVLAGIVLCRLATVLP